MARPGRRGPSSPRRLGRRSATRSPSRAATTLSAPIPLGAGRGHLPGRGRRAERARLPRAPTRPTSSRRGRPAPRVRPPPPGRITCDTLGDYIHNARLDYVVRDLASGTQTVNTHHINTRYGFGGGFFGDYTDIAVGSDNVFHAFWTDSNNVQNVDLVLRVRVHADADPPGRRGDGVGQLPGGSSPTSSEKARPPAGLLISSAGGALPEKLTELRSDWRRHSRGTPPGRATRTTPATTTEATPQLCLPAPRTHPRPDRRHTTGGFPFAHRRADCRSLRNPDVTVAVVGMIQVPRRTWLDPLATTTAATNTGGNHGRPRLARLLMVPPPVLRPRFARALTRSFTAIRATECVSPVLWRARAAARTNSLGHQITDLNHSVGER